MVLSLRRRASHKRHPLFPPLQPALDFTPSLVREDASSQTVCDLGARVAAPEDNRERWEPRPRRGGTAGATGATFGRFFSPRLGWNAEGLYCRRIAGGTGGKRRKRWKLCCQAGCRKAAHSCATEAALRRSASHHLCGRNKE